MFELLQRTWTFTVPGGTWVSCVKDVDGAELFEVQQVAVSVTEGGEILTHALCSDGKAREVANTDHPIVKKAIDIAGFQWGIFRGEELAGEAL